MSSNIREFEAGLDLFADEEVPQMLEDRRKAVALEALGGLVAMSPVDSGRFRGNWQATEQEPATGTVDVQYRGGSREARGAQATHDVMGREGGVIARVRGGFGMIWLSNNLPYAGVLNDGGPGRRAHKMVEKTMERLMTVMERIR